jgi:SAM-dependent methyltransferase
MKKWKKTIKASPLYPLIISLRRIYRILQMHWGCIGAAKQEILRYRCNICGRPNIVRSKELKRELPSCPYCGSTVRWRSIVHGLSTGLFGKSLAIPDFKIRKDLNGMGMSDWDGYAIPLVKIFNYVNAFYHQEPFLDITAPPPASWNLHFDFIISSDVMEHVTPPIQGAFDNLFRMLKPGGLLVFSVPFRRDHPTEEHFPDLYHFDFSKEGRKWVLKNETRTGACQTFRDLVFHGGPGLTIEMRLFGLDDLMMNLKAAGFTGLELLDSPTPEYGIVWNPHNPDKDPYENPILGLDAPTILARKPLSISERLNESA